MTNSVTGSRCDNLIVDGNGGSLDLSWIAATSKRRYAAHRYIEIQDFEIIDLEPLETPCSNIWVDNVRRLFEETHMHKPEIDGVVGLVAPLVIFGTFGNGKSQLSRRAAERVTLPDGATHEWRFYETSEFTEAVDALLDSREKAHLYQVIACDPDTIGHVQLLEPPIRCVSYAGCLVQYLSLSGKNVVYLLAIAPEDNDGPPAPRAGLRGMTAPGHDVGGTNSDEIYVLFGRANGRCIDVDLAALTAAHGFKIQSDVIYDGLGLSAAAAGDVNGDGIDDMIVVGTVLDDDGASNFCAAYGIYSVVVGSNRAGATRDDIDTTGLSVLDAIRGVAAGDERGFSVAALSDPSDDGVDSDVIGACYADGGDDARSPYVIYDGRHLAPSILAPTDIAFDPVRIAGTRARALWSASLARPIPKSGTWVFTRSSTVREDVSKGM